MNERNRFKQYVHHMAEIRRLSTPSLEGIREAEDYSQRLRENFLRIGELAVENRRFLEKDLFPTLKETHQFRQEEIDNLMEFGAALLNAESVENLDLPIANLLSEHLLQQAREEGNLAHIIRQMDKEIETCYALMNMVERIDAYPELVAHFRDLGLELGAIFRKLRTPESLATIEDMESRELILTNARYAAVFYENYAGDAEANEEDLVLLQETLEIADDARYKDLVPDFDWEYYRYRTLQYISLTTNFCNERGFTKEQLETINRYSEIFYQLWESAPERYRDWDRSSHVQMSYNLNRYLSGRITKEQYKQSLLDIYQTRSVQDYDEGGLSENLQLPTELLCLLKDGELSRKDEALLQTLYRNVLDYVIGMPNSGTFSFMLEYLSHFMRQFMEIPGGLTFEEMMQNLLAALHPPTYVHTRMVSQIASCLCEHLLSLRPDLFLGVLNCKTEEDVQAKRAAILDYTKHAALCHDIGKVFIIDTIFVYGRNLLDLEFDIIKTHPKMGAEMLSRYSSTEKYTDLSLGHHKWYDNSRGYPEEFDPRKSPVHTIICLMQCADCLDAATDTIGRSYKKGKELSEFLNELKAGSGTQYAPWLLDLMADPDTFRDVEWLLSTGREKNYRETYHLLKRMHEQASEV